MEKTKENTPSVLAFEKKLVPSDGFMFGTIWEKRADKKECPPLKLIEKSVRGTISNRLKPTQDPDDEMKKVNPQTVDNCALSLEQDTLKLNFTLKVLGGVKTPSACNNRTFNKTYVKNVEKYIENEKFTELARRYAINIASGRFLWRNRVGVEEVEVIVKIVGEGKEKWTFNNINMDDFSIESSDLDKLSSKIAKTLSSDNDYLLLDITAFAKVGKAQDVYPSEEMVLDKSKGKGSKGKILYQVNKQAAMHSQKIGNALRTIDTWYPDYADNNRAIAVEIYGSVTNLGVAYRKNKKVHFYTLFDKFARLEDEEALDSKEDEHYVMAVLVRGGVFGESTKNS
jgi:CRISPR-associated protein Csy3